MAIEVLVILQVTFPIDVDDFVKDLQGRDQHYLWAAISLFGVVLWVTGYSLHKGLSSSVLPGIGADFG